jgi:ATP-dependent Zn protease
VAKLLREADQRAAVMLTDNRDLLDNLAELLLERETVDGTDVDRIVGRITGDRAPVGASSHPATGSAAQ